MQELILATMGEMSLKGLNRKSFEGALLRALRSRMEGLGAFRIHTAQSAIYIEPTDETAAANGEEAFRRCSRVFGIAALARAAICGKEFATICQTAKSYLAEALQNAKTFKVTAKRADKSYPMNSLDIGRELGGWLLEQFPHLQVDVKNPELLVTVEIREQAAYVHGGKQKGAGGLPVPTSGRAALLLSGGIDSPVAGWQMAKRGLGLVAVHFASPPYTSPRAAAKVEALAGLLAGWAGPLPYYAVEYTRAQEYLRDKLPKQEYFTVLMRRSMLRITHAIAQKEKCEALITGESLAQVASQTLPAIACTDEVQDLPILRPCIGMDKTEITDIARHIGTFETSILPYEDCCTLFTPPHPRTRPKLEDIHRMEASLPDLPALEQEAGEAAAFQLVQEGR